MRLIDADALIKELDEQIQMPTFMDCLSAINTAPTIEPKTKVIAQVTFDEEKMREIVKEAVDRFKEEYEITDRPQGEWIDECPNCGARMFAKDTNVPNKKGADDD